MARSRQKLDREVGRRSTERLLIFTNEEEQLWLWPEVRPSGGIRLVPHSYRVGQRNPALVQRLQRIQFRLDDEQNLTTLLVRERVRTAFNAEAVTKKFYNDISQQREALSLAITGLEGEDRDLYASILLDRLIFLYFIQQKGFLDDDREYLSHRLQQVREQHGPDRFFDFYRDFLVPLFHQALGSSRPEYTDNRIRELIGNVPYVNGGLFSEISLEKCNDIAVPDAAFEKVFAVFDSYRWHLDERSTGDSNEINPEVLGYILEQYINQKEQGAYYTADDITGYMAGLTIAGYFLDQMDDPAVWAVLRENPDRYVHEALQHGTNSFFGSLEPEDWIQSAYEVEATSEVGLPTEKVREVADRIRNYRRVRTCIHQGKIASVNAATSANLNIVQLAVDWLSEQTAPQTLWKAWNTLRTLRVLDPTCGSGAFLLAAMKVLQELYEAVFVGIAHHVATGMGIPDARLEAIAHEVTQKTSPEYYLRKTIALHNLYGVDIMQEAVEIARLRLFLALAATVEERTKLEPLPDLDMNIRCGNILVGCVSTDDLKQVYEGDMTVMQQLAGIDYKAQKLRDSYQKFQKAQHEKGEGKDDAVTVYKFSLQHDTEVLRDELNHLFSRADDQTSDWDFAQWKESHQPFHWIAEFPEATLAGGFNVVTGNPPFIAKKKVVPHLYQFHGFETDQAPDIYAPCMERSVGLLSRQGRFAMISPISLVSGLRFESLRRFLANKLTSRWVTVFDLRPDLLFGAAQVRPAITLGCTDKEGSELQTSNLRRWRKQYRPFLFATIRHSASCPIQEMNHVWPLIGDENASVMLQILQSSNRQMGHFVRKHGKYKVGRKAVMNRRFMTAFRIEPPCWIKTGNVPSQRIPQTTVKWMHFDRALHQQAAFLIFAGRFGHWLWTTIGDAFNITDSMLKWFPCDLDMLAPVSQQLANLAEQLDRAQMNAPMVDRNRNFIGGYDIGACRDITDEADQLIMNRLGVGEYWPTVLMLDNRIVKSERISATTDTQWLKAWTPTRGSWDPSMPE